MNDWRFSEYVYLENGAAPPAAVPDDPELVISRFFSGSAQLPNPEIHVGPEPTELAVKVPVWFWVTDPAVEPLVVNGFLVTVTATPTVASTTWQVKEPVERPESLHWSFPDPVVCDGLGSPPPAERTRETEPPCGYTFRWRATAERTDGSCVWPVTAPITWSIPWSATTGQSGTLTVETSTTTDLRVGEWRTMLVDDPSWTPEPQVNPRCRS